MAYTTINKSSLNMNTKLYTGDGNQQNVTGVGFEPSWTWVKQRLGTTDHSEQDAPRGVGKQLQPNDTSAETSNNNSLVNFISDGFTVGFGTGDADPKVNLSGGSYASWNWKAGTAVSGNTSGSGAYKTYTGSVNATAGFSIIKYTGNGTNGMTIPHHLGAVPKMIMVKRLDASANWQIYHTSLGATKYIQLNQPSAAATSSSRWYDVEPTSSVFTLGTDSDVNVNDATFVAYSFSEVSGYSRFNTFYGNNAVNGTFVYTGFSPAFVMFRKADTSANWFMMNNKMFPANGVNASGGDQKYLYANTTNNEQGGYGQTDLISNGFKFRSSDGDLNGATRYLYMAFGQTLVGTNTIPNNAR